MISRIQFLISRIRFLDIKNSFLDIKNSILDIKNSFLDIKKSNSWYQEIEFVISRIKFLISRIVMVNDYKRKGIARIHTERAVLTFIPNGRVVQECILPDRSGVGCRKSMYRENSTNARIHVASLQCVYRLCDIPCNYFYILYCSNICLFRPLVKVTLKMFDVIFFQFNYLYKTDKNASFKNVRRQHITKWFLDMLPF